MHHFPTEATQQTIYFLKGSVQSNNTRLLTRLCTLKDAVARSHKDTLLWSSEETRGGPRGDPVMRDGARGQKFGVCEARNKVGFPLLRRQIPHREQECVTNSETLKEMSNHWRLKLGTCA